MTTARLHLFSNGGVRLAFEVHPGMEALFEALSSALTPYFRPVEDETPDITVRLEPFARLPATAWSRSVAPSAIRRSSAAPFNLDVRIISRELAVDEATQTAYRFEGPGEVRIFGSPGSFFHLLELTRYAALAVEQDRGAVVLHASAASFPEGAVLIVGAKGAGKSTTLLRLLQDGSARLLSGDKVLVGPDEAGARGWPDYPHIGIGTLRAVPAFARACGVALTVDGQRRADNEKVLIAPDVFRTALEDRVAAGPVPIRAIVFPEVSSPVTELRALSPAERDPELLRDHVEDVSAYHILRWHGLMDHILAPPADATRRLDELRRAPWFAARGPLDAAGLAALRETLSRDVA